MKHITSKRVRKLWDREVTRSLCRIYGYNFEGYNLEDVYNMADQVCAERTKDSYWHGNLREDRFI